MKKLLFLPLLFTLLVLVNGCATHTNTALLNPTYHGGKISPFHYTVVLTVKDTRANPATVFIKKSDNTHTEQTPHLTQLITRAVSQAINANGGTLSAHAATSLTLTISQFNATVTQGFAKHSSRASINFVLLATGKGRQFSKTYKAQQEFSAPLQVDQAKIEGQLNKLTEQLINRIISDQALINFLQKGES